MSSLIASRGALAGRLLMGRFRHIRKEMPLFAFTDALLAIRRHTPDRLKHRPISTGRHLLALQHRRFRRRRDGRGRSTELIDLRGHALAWL